MGSVKRFEGDRPTEAKLITVKFPSGVKEAEQLLVLPGNTAKEILKKLELDGQYQLSKGSPDTIFGIDENLYPRIEEGDLLFVTSKVDAGFQVVSVGS